MPRRATLLTLALALAGCDTKPKAPGGAGDAARGRQLYQAYCVACHGQEPTKDGPVGPAIAGSSLALLEARVLRVEYPPGYVPKRQTKLMQPLLHLASGVPDLAAYLKAP